MTRGYASPKPIESGGCFLLDLEGHKTVAVRLPANVANEISGQDLLASLGFFAKMKAKLRFAPEPESWLAVTSVDNPLLEQLDRFKALLVQHIAEATGKPVTKSNLAVSASVLVNGSEQLPEAVDGLSSTATSTA